MVRHVWMVVVLVLASVGQALAQQNRIDTVTPMAPERAAYGSLAVGVRTITATDRDRADILNTKEGAAVARDDRTLTIEVWYPAVLVPRGSDGVYSAERDGRLKHDHTYWKGFKPRTATGLMLERLQPGK